MSRHLHLCADDTALAIDDLRSSRTWRQLAEYLNYPPTYAAVLHGIAHGKPGQTTPEGEQELRRRLGLSYDVRHIVDVPADHDAAVHLHPNGNGSLHTYTVPEDAEVVIVPAGARVVQSKPQSKPARKRWRLDLTEYAGRVTAEQVRELVDAWLTIDAVGMPAAIMQELAAEPGLLLSLLDTWLAEDVGTDPAEVAAVLARLE